VEHTPSSNDAIRAVAILMAITGHLDRPGANVFTAPPKAAPTDITLKDRYTQALIDKLVGPEFPPAFQPFLEGPSSAYYRILESVLTEKPYPVRGIIAPGTQPSVSTRGTKNVPAALKKLDFFVVADVARTADMPYADVVMPVATSYEVDHPFQMVPGWLMAANRVIEPLGPFNSIFQFFLDLGAEDGLVSVDDAPCIGCRSCAEACPFGVPQFDPTDTMRKCDLCRGQNLAGAVPPCVDTRPGKALSFVEVKPAEKLRHEKLIAQKLKSGLT
jgi:anaerobic selenocysteine-containing dehydrogenase